MTGVISIENVSIIRLTNQVYTQHRGKSDEKSDSVEVKPNGGEGILLSSSVSWLVVPASADFDSPGDLARPSRGIDQSGSIALCARACTNPDQLTLAEPASSMRSKKFVLQVLRQEICHSNNLLSIKYRQNKSEENSHFNSDKKNTRQNTFKTNETFVLFM